MVYKFRVIFDTEEDVLRDFTILDSDTLEDLHLAISNAFGFDGTEMASFYTCDNNWNQADEIPLFDMGDAQEKRSSMKDFVIKDVLDKEQTKIIYVYDFLNMYTFFVELAAIEKEQSGTTYPSLLFAQGEISETDQQKFQPDFDQYDHDFDDNSYDQELNEFDEFSDFPDDPWN